MERVLPWLALLLAAGAIALGVFEIDQRADEAPLAVPTAVPSPIRSLSPRPMESPDVTATSRPAATTSPTAEPTATARRTEALPSSTRTATPAPPAPTATATPKPPPTPTPSPVVADVTPGPTDDGRGSTPHTGGGAVLPGFLIAAIAMAARVGLRLRRR